MPVIVLVGLFGGFGTLVEAGAITVVYCLRRGVPRSCANFLCAAISRASPLECVTVVGGVLMIIGVAMGLT